jgi:hypothetical protein
LDAFDHLVSATRISKKKLRVVAAQKSDILREEWPVRMANYKPEKLMFLDEIACYEKAAQRRMGWCPFGIIPEVIRPLRRSERFSILPAYTFKGHKDWRILLGSFSKARFLDFTRDVVLPICVRDWTVIVLDNAAYRQDSIDSDTQTQAN